VGQQDCDQVPERGEQVREVEASEALLRVELFDCLIAGDPLSGEKLHKVGLHDGAELPADLHAGGDSMLDGLTHRLGLTGERGTVDSHLVPATVRAKPENLSAGLRDGRLALERLEQGRLSGSIGTGDDHQIRQVTGGCLCETPDGADCKSAERHRSSLRTGDCGPCMTRRITRDSVRYPV
jgi:hypothetical protein